MLVIFIRILLGIFFIISGSLKLYPIEFFEFSFVETGVATLTSAAFLARIFIGLEFFLGGLLIIGFKQKQTIIAGLALVIFLSFYVIHLAVTEGLNTNCRCLGEQFQLTPLYSLIKNVFIIGLLGVLLSKNQTEHTSTIKKWISVAAFFVAFAMPFILNPVSGNLLKTKPDKFESYAFQSEKLQAHPFHGDTAPDFNEGNHIVAVYMAGCRFCRIAMHKLALMDKRSDFPQITIISSGETDYIEHLFNETNSSYPYYLVNTGDLTKLNGSRAFPGILFIKDGTVMYRWRGSTFHERYVMGVMRGF